MIIKYIGAIVAAVLIVTLTAVLFALPTYFIWNWLCPTLFGLPTITLLQALGLNFLSGLLVKGSSTTTSTSK
jgi:hypothetical protein